MGINWGAPLEKGLRFGVNPKRWLPVFIVDIVFWGTLLLYFMGNYNDIITVFSAMSGNPSDIFSLAGLAVGMFAWIALYALVKLYVNGALIHQAYKEKEFEKSWKVSLGKYLPLLATMIIVAIVTQLVGMIPFVGFILTIIAGLVFFFVYQSVIVKGRGPIDAIKESWMIFKKNVLRVILIWILISLITVIIFGIFAIPLMVAGLWTVFPTLAVGGESVAAGAVLASLLDNIWMLAGMGVILLVGMAIATCFSVKATTEYYLQLAKRKLF